MGWTSWVVGAVAGLAVAGLALPSVLFGVGQRRARECLARIEAPRGPELPRCDALQAWFKWPERVRWTSRPAKRARQELEARMAVARYEDAAVGTPDRARLERARAGVVRAGEAIRADTGLLRLGELGPVIPTPELGELAFGLGDSDALDGHAFEWTQWFTSRHALEAALLRADLPRAVRLAEHYAGRPDHDLRLKVGALLCSGGQAPRGIEEIASVETARAEKRTANFARHFGSARVLLEACAAIAGEPPPAVPAYGSAGEWDQRERLAVARLRLAALQPGCGPPPRLKGCALRARINEAATDILDLLDSPGPLEFRAELLAAVAPFVTDAAIAADLARPRGEEPAPKSRTPLTLLRMIEPGSAAAPFVPAADLSRAADSLLALRPEHHEVRALAGALLGLAARARAGLGARDPAVELARKAAALGTEDGLAAALLESSVLYLSGDEPRAMATLERSLAGSRSADPTLAATWLQLAAFRAAVGRHDEALAAAREGLAMARAARHAALGERGQWQVAALEALATARARAERPPPSADAPLLPPEPLPPVGAPDPGIPDDARERDLAATLAVWRRWVQDSSAERRAHRYAAMHARGDGSEARVEQLVLAGLLVDRASEVEPWLDAFYALDAQGTSLRAYCWARGQAARWRGDGAAASLWLERYRALERLANDPLLGDLYQELRL